VPVGGGAQQRVDLLTEVGRSTSKTQSLSDALSSGTRTARPSSRPRSSGKMSPIAVAEPVVVGMSDSDDARARRRSLCGASTTVWVFVMSWSVVMDPRAIPIPSWITLTTGARQLVVHDAAVTTSWRSSSYRWSLTPTTTFSPPSFTGAATTTLRTPRSK
jgi:hypothetical protein